MCGDGLVAGGEVPLEIARLCVAVHEHGAGPVPGGGQQGQQVPVGQRVQQAPLSNQTVLPILKGRYRTKWDFEER